MGPPVANTLKLKMISTCPIIDSNWKKIILTLAEKISLEIYQSLKETWQSSESFEAKNTNCIIQNINNHFKKSVSLKHNNKTYSLDLFQNPDNSYIELTFCINDIKSLSFEFSS